MIDPGLSTPSDFSIAELGLDRTTDNNDNNSDNEFTSSCASGSQPFGKTTRKGATDGSCDSDGPGLGPGPGPGPDDAATEYPDQGVTGGTSDFLRRLTQSYLNIDRKRVYNPCSGTVGSYPLCCLGPRDLAEPLNVLLCDLLLSTAACRSHWVEGASVYCCFGVEIEAQLKWGLKGLACPATIEF